MKHTPIEQLVMEYARGEPMDIGDRERVESALLSSSQLRALCAAQQQLSTDLVALREFNQNLATSRLHDDALAKVLSRLTRSRRAFRWNRITLAAAAVLIAAVGIGGIFGPSWLPTRERPPEPTALATSTATVQEFLPLPFGPAMGPTEGYTVVRVRLGRSSLLHTGLLLPGPPQDGLVEADLLLGEYGIAHGIRIVHPAGSATSARQAP